MKITKETNIAELLVEHPETAEVFLEYGMHCAGCMAATFDSVEQGVKAHGLSEETLEEIVNKLNQSLTESNKETENNR